MFWSFHDVCMYSYRPSLMRLYVAHRWRTNRRYLLSKCHTVSNITSLGPVTTERPSGCDCHDAFKCSRALRSDILCGLPPCGHLVGTATVRTSCRDCHRADILYGLPQCGHLVGTATVRTSSTDCHRADILYGLPQCGHLVRTATVRTSCMDCHRADIL